MEYGKDHFSRADGIRVWLIIGTSHPSNLGTNGLIFYLDMMKVGAGQLAKACQYVLGS